MKILQIASVIPYPPNDGGRVGLYHLTRQLRKGGFEVHYAAPRARANDADGFSKEAVVHLLDVDPTRSIWGALKYLLDSRPYNVAKYYTKPAYQQLDALLRTEQFDVIQAETLYLAEYALQLRDSYGIPVSIREHNMESEITRRYRDHARNPFIRLYAAQQYEKMRRFEGRAVEQFDLVFPVTRDDEAKLFALAPAMKSVVLPAGVDLEQVRYTVPCHRDDRVLFFTNFDWLPNRDSFSYYLKEILPGLRARRPGLKTLVVGKYADRHVRNDERLGIEVIGFVPDLNTLSSLASVAVVPLRIGSGIRLKILEMMGLGLAIVTTSLGAEGIAGEDKKHFILADTTADFARSTDELLGRPDRVAAIGANARELVEAHYSWDAIGRIMCTALTDLVHKHKSKSG